jgi:hypothetical protein
MSVEASFIPMIKKLAIYIKYIKNIMNKYNMNEPIDILARIQSLPDELQNKIFFYGIQDRYKVDNSILLKYYEFSKPCYAEWFEGSIIDEILKVNLGRFDFKTFFITKYSSAPPVPSNFYT